MEGIQGAVLKVKLKYLEGWTEARRAAAANYAQFFSGSAVRTPEALAHNRHVYHVYAIRTAHRAEWMDALQKQGIASGIHYPIPVHLLPAYADLGYKAGQFPHSELAAAETMSLPMYPELTVQQCQTVATAVKALAEQNPLKAAV
jgi:dTDP-4-amino-4,6-dideoxygalactose transaminase